MSAVHPTAVPLDRLRNADGVLTDSAGRQVVLRGMVTITADERGPMELTGADFDRWAGWGFNCQQVRLEGSRMGVLSCEADPGYLDKLDRWVTWAAACGVYTVFKMTVYDVPELGGWLKAFDRDMWQRFWDPASDWREQRLEAWRPLWERMAGRPEVLGYDILNEPVAGREAADFPATFLYPFYEQAGTALRAVDPEALLVAQPHTGPASREAARATGGRYPHGPQVALSDPRCLYAPHFYADVFVELTDEKYEHHFAGYLREAEVVGAPLLIGEYGQPHRQTPMPPGMGGLRLWNHHDARRVAELFDRHAVSALRIWYSDDAAWTPLAPGWEETERMDYLLRPYLQRVAGRTHGWTFEPDANHFRASLDIDPAIDAPTVIVVHDRWYAHGGDVLIDGQLVDAGLDDGRVVIEPGMLAEGGHEVIIRAT